MREMNLHLPATDHISVARQAAEAVRELRGIKRTYGDKALRRQAEEQCRQADVLALRLLAASHVFLDPNGWLEEAKRKMRDAPPVADGMGDENGLKEVDGLPPEEIRNIAVWAKGFDERWRKEMSKHLATQSRLCSRAAQDLRIRMDLADAIDRPTPWAHLGASPFFPAHYRMRGNGPNGTVRLVRESAGSRTGFFLLRNYMRSHRYDTADPHVRAALFLAHSMEDFLLSALGRTEAVLGGKAIAAHHATILLRAKQARLAGLEKGRLGQDVRKLGDLLANANPGRLFVHVPGVVGPSLPSARTLARVGMDRGNGAAIRTGRQALPDGRTIDIQPEV